jgi:hypothetical protein
MCFAGRFLPLSERGRNRLLLAARVARLKSLTAGEVMRFLADEKKSKAEFAQLAAVRFAIPMAKLSRSDLAEARELIRAGLLRECRGLKRARPRRP